MKPLPHDPHDESLDELIAAALHGELTPEERAQFDVRLQTDPAAQAAYQEAQVMHDLLEKTHKNAQPDPAFEQRMVSGVRRKIKDEERPRETAWGSVLVLWNGVKSFRSMLRPAGLAAIVVLGVIMAGVALGPITSGIKQAKQSAAMQEARQRRIADYDSGIANPAATPPPAVFAMTSAPAKPAEFSEEE